MADNSKSIILIGHDLSLTGAPIALLNMAIQLEKMGHNPVIVSDKEGPLRKEIAQAGITVVVSSELYSEGFIERISEQADIIIANTLESLPAVVMLNGADIPVLWWIHESSALYHRQHKYKLPLWLYNNVLVAAVGSRAKRNLAEYRPQYRIRELIYPLPLLPTANDSRRIISDGPSGITTFAIIGSVEKRKGQDILVEAINRLSESAFARSRFIFVGRGQEDDIVNLVISKSKQYPDKIIYIPQIDRNHIGQFYNQIDCLICASRDDPMPVVVAEACQTGKLIICSDNAGSAQFIKEYNAGLIYHDDSSEELSACITRICNEEIPETDAMMKSAKRLYDDIFSVEAFSKEFETLLEDMTNARKGESLGGDKIETDPAFVSLLETANAGIAELRYELDIARSDNGQLRNENEQLQKDFQAVLESFNEIENAFFWKMTKPAREVLDRIRSRKRI